MVLQGELGAGSGAVALPCSSGASGAPLKLLTDRFHLTAKHTADMKESFMPKVVVFQWIGMIDAEFMSLHIIVS